MEDFLKTGGTDLTACGMVSTYTARLMATLTTCATNCSETKFFCAQMGDLLGWSAVTVEAWALISLERLTYNKPSRELDDGGFGMPLRH